MITNRKEYDELKDRLIVICAFFNPETEECQGIKELIDYIDLLHMDIDSMGIDLDDLHCEIRDRVEEIDGLYFEIADLEKRLSDD